MLNSEGFDLWANNYDNDVNINQENNNYPFAGYKEVLNGIYRLVRQKDRAKVLDIGFGTGILTTQLYRSGCMITGIDFSSKMIDIAKCKMPEARLIKCDFSKGLPSEITNQAFDYIISTYAMHHLEDGAKISLIKSICDLLAPNGLILIGDVSFETEEELGKCKERYSNVWDNDEYYFVVDGIRQKLGDAYYCNYKKVSHCAGILTITKK